MDIEDVRKLARLMQEAGLTELEVENRSGKARLVRGAVARRPAAAISAADDDAEAPEARQLAASAADGEESLSSGDDNAASRIPDGMTAITSPMVGTFYRAGAPDAAPFASVGDVVRPGQVLCIIEAMKMMNEIHAEAAARIVSVTAENGSSVEYGSPLFLVELLD